MEETQNGVDGVRTSRATMFPGHETSTVPFFVSTKSWTRDSEKAMLQRTGLLLNGQQFSFQIKVNYAFHFEFKVLGQNPSCMRTRGCFQSQWAMSLPGVYCSLSGTRRCYLLLTSWSDWPVNPSDLNPRKNLQKRLLHCWFCKFWCVFFMVGRLQRAWFLPNKVVFYYIK